MHEITLILIAILVPLIIILSYKIGQKKQQRELERIKRQEIDMKYLLQKPQYYSTNQNGYSVYDEQNTNVPPNNNMMIYPVQNQLQKFNDHITNPSQLNPNKRLSFSEVYSLPKQPPLNIMNEYEQNVIHSILGPTPPSSLHKYGEQKATIPFSTQNYQFIENKRNSVNQPFDDVFHSKNHTQYPANGFDLPNDDPYVQMRENNYIKQSNVQIHQGSNYPYAQMKENDPYYQNTQPLQSQYSSQQFCNGSGDTLFSFQKQTERDFFRSPSLGKNHKIPPFQYNHNPVNQVQYRVIPHINTPIKMSDQKVPYFLQDRKNLHIR